MRIRFESFNITKQDFGKTVSSERVVWSGRVFILKEAY